MRRLEINNIDENDQSNIIGPGNMYQYEIMDRTHIILEMIESSLLNNAGITESQTKLVQSVLDILCDLYQDAGKQYYLEDTKELK